MLKFRPRSRLDNSSSTLLTIILPPNRNLIYTTPKLWRCGIVCIKKTYYRKFLDFINNLKAVGYGINASCPSASLSSSDSSGNGWRFLSRGEIMLQTPSPVVPQRASPYSASSSSSPGIEAPASISTLLFQGGASPSLSSLNLNRHCQFVCNVPLVIINRRSCWGYSTVRFVRKAMTSSRSGHERWPNQIIIHFA